MSVHYKFKSGREAHTITFDSLHISVGELKKAIMQQRKIGKSSDLDLQITNAQTKEVYESESILIPKNTSVVVARVPVSNSKKVWNNKSDTKVNENSYSNTEEKTIKVSNLAEGSEDDKIKEMLTQSTKDYDPSKYARGKGPLGPLPPNYTCYRCGKPGHYIKNCPTNNIDVKRSTGIPRSFMIPASADQKGAMITASGEYAVPIIDRDAYKEIKKDKPPFFSTEVELEIPKVEIPDDLKCSLCNNLLQDAVLVPCCGNSFCDECIRLLLLDSDNHQCPSCKEIDVSPDTLIPNRFLRLSVVKFRNDSGCPLRVAEDKREEAKKKIDQPKSPSTNRQENSAAGSDNVVGNRQIGALKQVDEKPKKDYSIVKEPDDQPLDDCEKNQNQINIEQSDNLGKDEKSGVSNELIDKDDSKSDKTDDTELNDGTKSTSKIASAVPVQMSTNNLLHPMQPNYALGFNNGVGRYRSQIRVRSSSQTSTLFTRVPGQLMLPRGNFTQNRTLLPHESTFFNDSMQPFPPMNVPLPFPYGGQIRGQMFDSNMYMNPRGPMNPLIPFPNNMVLNPINGGHPMLDTDGGYYPPYKYDDYDDKVARFNRQLELRSRRNPNRNRYSRSRSRDPRSKSRSRSNTSSHSSRSSSHSRRSPRSRRRSPDKYVRREKTRSRSRSPHRYTKPSSLYSRQSRAPSYKYNKRTERDRERSKRNERSERDRDYDKDKVRKQKFERRRENNHWEKDSNNRETGRRDSVERSLFAMTTGRPDVEKHLKSSAEPDVKDHNFTQQRNCEVDTETATNVTGDNNRSDTNADLDQPLCRDSNLEKMAAQQPTISLFCDDDPIDDGTMCVDSHNSLELMAKEEEKLKPIKKEMDRGLPLNELTKDKDKIKQLHSKHKRNRSPSRSVTQNDSSDSSDRESTQSAAKKQHNKGSIDLNKAKSDDRHRNSKSKHQSSNSKKLSASSNEDKHRKSKENGEGKYQSGKSGSSKSDKPSANWLQENDQMSDGNRHTDNMSFLISDDRIESLSTFEHHTQNDIQPSTSDEMEIKIQEDYSDLEIEENAKVDLIRDPNKEAIPSNHSNNKENVSNDVSSSKSSIGFKAPNEIKISEESYRKVKISTSKLTEKPLLSVTIENKAKIGSKISVKERDDATNESKDKSKRNRKENDKRKDKDKKSDKAKDRGGRGKKSSGSREDGKSNSASKSKGRHRDRDRGNQHSSSHKERNFDSSSKSKDKKRDKDKDREKNDRSKRSHRRSRSGSVAQTRKKIKSTIDTSSSKQHKSSKSHRK